MRILVLNNEFPPLGGGTGVINLHLFEELRAYSFLSVDLITSALPGDGSSIEQFAPHIRIFKVPARTRDYHHATMGTLLLYSIRALLLARKLHREKPYDLSFAFAGVPAGGVSYALALCYRLPYIVSLQGPDIPDFEARYKPVYPLLKPIIRRIWANATTVFANSREHRACAERFCAEYLGVNIPNGVDTSQFFPRTELRTSFKVVCSARLVRRKGQRELIQAVARLKSRGLTGFTVELVGTGDDECYLKRLAEDLGVKELVYFRGLVKREDMARLYQEASLFVLPSFGEGMSLALLEALASGLPAVVTNVGGSEELIDEGVNGFIIPSGDVESLTRAIEKFVKDPSLCEQMGKFSVQKSRQFDWTEISQRYVQLFTIASQADGKTSSVA